MHGNTEIPCVSPETIHTTPQKGIFFLGQPPPIPIWKFHLSFKFVGLTEPLTHWKSLSLLWREYGYFLELNKRSYFALHSNSFKNNSNNGNHKKDWKSSSEIISQREMLFETPKM